MVTKIPITEYLEIELESEQWRCRQCGQELYSARDNYKKGCLIYERNPAEIHPPKTNGEYDFTPDPAWCVYVEFYCPSCGTMIDVEALPPGHPVTNDIEIDLDILIQRMKGGVK